MEVDAEVMPNFMLGLDVGFLFISTNRYYQILHESSRENGLKIDN